MWTPAELHHKLATGQRFTLLDVRNAEEYGRWRIEGTVPLASLNLPYFDLLDLEDESEDVVQAVERAVPQRISGRLPEDEPVLVVCARGDTSPLVAEGLRRQGYAAYNLEGGMLAWGDHYELRTILESGRLAIHQLIRPAKGCLSYLLESSGEALVVDAPRHLDPWLHLIDERGLRVRAVMDSHLQADHLSGGVALARRLSAEYWLHPYDAIQPMDLLPATFDYRPLAGEVAFQLGEVWVRPLHLPGHTLGMTNPWVDERYLLSGDTLFINAIGRPDLGGRAQAWAPLLFRSLQRLLKLPDETVILPAHFASMQEADAQGCYQASLGELRECNPGLRMVYAGQAAFADYILHSLPAHPPSYDEIRRINTGLLEVDETRASELELGRNLCALSHPAGEQRLAA
jgi:glyoxylase-like metal-dependent hydrolase (beta-lactamase superfamily II)